jgi:hypothetical protein
VPQQPPGAPTQAQVQLGTSWQQVGGHADGQGQPYLQQQQQPYPQHHPHPQQHPPAQVTVQGQGHQPQAIGRLAGGREGVMYTVLQVEEATQGGSERVLRAVSPYQVNNTLEFCTVLCSLLLLQWAPTACTPWAATHPLLCALQVMLMQP